MSPNIVDFIALTIFTSIVVFLVVHAIDGIILSFEELLNPPEEADEPESEF